jgi:hypothetical protein
MDFFGLPEREDGLSLKEKQHNQLQIHSNCRASQASTQWIGNVEVGTKEVKL